MEEQEVVYFEKLKEVIMGCKQPNEVMPRLMEFIAVVGSELNFDPEIYYEQTESMEEWVKELTYAPTVPALNKVCYDVVSTLCEFVEG